MKEKCWKCGDKGFTVGRDERGFEIETDCDECEAGASRRKRLRYQMALDVLKEYYDEGYKLVSVVMRELEIQQEDK